MKIFLFLLPALMACSSVKSQNNSFAATARWYNTSVNWSGACVEHYEFNAYFNGDTIINGNRYYKLYEQGVHYSTMKGPGSNCPPNTSYYTNLAGLVRYDQKKILTWNNNHDNVFLDYNLHTGDSIFNVDYLAGGQPLRIISTDSVLISGVYLKRFYYHSDEVGTTQTRYIIEMIGSFHGFTSHYTNNFEENNNLNCYSENNNVLYSEPAGGSPCNLTVSIQEQQPAQSATLFPNPASEVLFISTGEAVKKLCIRNAFGQVVLSQEVPAASIHVSSLSPGIYFIGIETATGTLVKKFIKD